MADSPTTHTFPTEDSLCEACGYPLKGLSQDTVCPECGYAVAESSPAKRTGIEYEFETKFFRLMELLLAPFYSAKQTFRAMPIDGSNRQYRWLLLLSSVTALGVWSALGSKALEGTYRNGDVFTLLIPLFVIALTYVEVIGVTAFSRRRGWRVPLALAERVCCRAAIGWVFGLLIAGAGMWVLKWTAAGQPWFEQNLGLVRVRWLFYGLLFVLSFLWFETLVWIGVRQVRYANAWSQSPLSPPQDTPKT
ncbi:MAG: hypothetical protein AB8C95_01370 [Phycisphaeraceae bacterium]